MAKNEFDEADEAIMKGEGNLINEDYQKDQEMIREDQKFPGEDRGPSKEEILLQIHNNFIQTSDQDSIEYTIDGKGIKRLSRVKIYGNAQREGDKKFAARALAIFENANRDWESWEGS